MEFPGSGMGAGSPQYPPASPLKMFQRQDSGIKSRIQTFTRRKRRTARSFLGLWVKRDRKKKPLPASIRMIPAPVAILLFRDRKAFAPARHIGRGKLI